MSTYVRDGLRMAYNYAGPMYRTYWKNRNARIPVSPSDRGRVRALPPNSGFFRPRRKRANSIRVRGSRDIVMNPRSFSPMNVPRIRQRKPRSTKAPVSVSWDTSGFARLPVKNFEVRMLVPLSCYQLTSSLVPGVPIMWGGRAFAVMTLFQKYRVESMSLAWLPSTPSTTGGSIAIAWSATGCPITEVESSLMGAVIQLGGNMRSVWNVNGAKATTLSGKWLPAIPHATGEFEGSFFVGTTEYDPEKRRKEKIAQRDLALSLVDGEIEASDECSHSDSEELVKKPKKHSRTEVKPSLNTNHAKRRRPLGSFYLPDYGYLMVQANITFAGPINLSEANTTGQLTLTVSASGYQIDPNALTGLAWVGIVTESYVYSTDLGEIVNGPMFAAVSTNYTALTITHNATPLAYTNVNDQGAITMAVIWLN